MYQKKIIGGIIKGITDFFLPSMPKAIRTFLKAHGDEPLTSLNVYRAPLDSTSNTFLDILTLGDWDAIKSTASIDNLFHTYAIINDKYIYEKEAIPRLHMASNSDLNRPKAESMSVPIHHGITLSEFVDRAAKHMGDNYFSYDGFKNNCQDFLIGSLRGNHLQNNDIIAFLKQDIQKLIEHTPSLSKYVGKEITDLAGSGERLWSELADKRGGTIRRKRTF
jgi:hypothetical protein